MRSIRYFAYGSNMLRERLTARCPSARVVGLAKLPGHRLTFDKISKDESEKCAFESSQDDELLGVLWDIRESERVLLDRLEGAGAGYEAATVTIIGSAGAMEDALTYRATRRSADLEPYDWYWALVLAGAQQHAFPPTYIERLRNEPRVADPELNRPGRLDAHMALRLAGYGDLIDG